jgi:hypothetical protein
MKEIKVGDLGWFWDDNPEIAIFGELENIHDVSSCMFDTFDSSYYHFSHKHPTERFKVVECKSESTNNKKEAGFDYKSLIGKRVKGFKFDDRDGCNFTNRMNDYIGKIGTVDSFNEKYESYCVVFEDGEDWYYPKELILNHIEPEPRYRAYTFQDRDEFRGRWIRRKGDDSVEYCIIELATSNVIFYGSKAIHNLDYLFENFEYADGTPFGKLLTPSENISNTN